MGSREGLAKGGAGGREGSASIKHVEGRNCGVKGEEGLAKVEFFFFFKKTSPIYLLSSFLTAQLLQF